MMFNLFKSRKQLFSALYASIAVVILMVSFSAAHPASSVTYTVENGLIRLANADYEVALNAATGGLAYVLDQSTGRHVSEGSAGGSLWAVALDNGKSLDSLTDNSQFAYSWDEAQSTLTLTFSGSVTVQVTIMASDGPALRLQATVTNNTGAVISSFDFPDALKVTEADVTDALLPLMPGAQIGPQFFSDGRTYINEYPGVMFADYLALRSAGGKLAIYGQKGERLQPTLIGFEHLKDEAGVSGMTHRFRTWITDQQAWTSPTVVVIVGQDYPATIQSYRVDNGIDAYPSLTDKLGDQAAVYFAAPMYKLDLAALRLTFNALQDAVINKLNVPGMIHFAAYTTGGHDHNYPDFIPPDKKWGTTEDFASLISLIHSKGGLAVPYTNFSWWNTNSPTLSKLPADTPLTDLINVKDSHGLPGFESYGANSGFVMNLHNPFVQQKIAEQHDALLNTIGADAIFEDQWGARAAPYDFNPAGLETDDPSTAYFEGVLDHYRAQISSNLMTEEGVDVLAKDGVAFMGTNYLWDMLGYRGDTAGVTTYYPMAGMLLRDKVLFYQHDLARETWTQDKDMLRWNLAQGYGLSNAFLDQSIPGLNMDNPWLNLVGVFQKYALANYADQLVMSFEDIGDHVTKTAFAAYTVYADWDSANAYAIGGHTLPPGGVMTLANDGSVTAGVFSAYNGSALSDGDHYLVEVRSDDGIQVFQPVGADTTLHITKNAAWSAVTVTAYSYDGTAIASVEAALNGDDVAFTYAAAVDGKTVGYYRVTPAE